MNARTVGRRRPDLGAATYERGKRRRRAKIDDIYLCPYTRLQTVAIFPCVLSVQEKNSKFENAGYCMI